MSGDMAFAYLLAGLFVGVVSGVISMDLHDVPSGAPPAIGFLCGLLWPLAATLALLYGLLRAGLAVGGGFVVLWRAFRPARREGNHCTVHAVCRAASKQAERDWPRAKAVKS